MTMDHSGLTPSIPEGGEGVRSSEAALIPVAADGEIAGQPKERPILFSGPMVHALMSGRKTQTRRIVKGEALRWLDEAGFTPGFTADPGNNLCPYGKTGDRLWVKETWRPITSLQPWDMDVTYRADGERRTVKDGEFGDRDWRMPKAAATGNVSPLFMPRWASRLTLEITDVRIERLEDCSERDALAEGIESENDGWMPRYRGTTDLPWRYEFPRDAYRDLWEAINGAASWAANPWVWAVSFRVIQDVSTSTCGIPEGDEP